MDVQFSVNLNQIIELNEREQSLLLSVVLRYSWRDDYMTWYPEMHGGIDQIVVRAEDVWTPDIFLANSEADNFDSKYRTNILITYKGDALWVPPGLQKSSCGVEMELFPFDTQICTLRYGSWMYSENFINLQHAYPSQASARRRRPRRSEFLKSIFPPFVPLKIAHQSRRPGTTLRI